MSPGARYRVNSPKVIHQTVDDEAIIINLDTGNYYSLNTSGTALWNLLSTGMTLEEVGRSLSNRYDAEPIAINETVENLVDQLQKEELLIPAAIDGVPPTPGSLPAAATVKSALETPVLSKYTDMQELITLDPIHEVDEAGWPSQKK